MTESAFGENNVIAVSGGTFSSKVEKAYCVDKYDSVKNEDDMYEVIEISVSKQLTLGNALTMTYIVDSNGYDVSYVTFSIYDATLNGGNGGYTEPVKGIYNGKGFSFTGINPQRMVDTIKAVVYLVKDGKTYTYIVEDYSVKDYCLGVLNDDSYNSKYNEIISNLVKYGEEAQLFTKYRVDDLISSYFTSCKAYNPVSHLDEIKNVEKLNKTTEVAGGIKIIGKQVVLNNAFKVRIYFSLEEGTNIDDVKFEAKLISNSGNTQVFDSFKSYGSGIYYFEYTGVNATELDNEIIFTSSVGAEQNDSLSFNINWYLNYLIENDPSTASLAEALFNYGYTCDKF